MTGIAKAKIDGVKFGRTLGSKNPKTADCPSGYGKVRN